MKYCHFYTCVVADILLYLKSLDSAQTVEFSRRTSSQSATRHKNMISAHRNMFSVLREIDPWLQYRVRSHMCAFERSRDLLNCDLKWWAERRTRSGNCVKWTQDSLTTAFIISANNFCCRFFSQIRLWSYIRKSLLRWGLFIFCASLTNMIEFNRLSGTQLQSKSGEGDDDDNSNTPNPIHTRTIRSFPISFEFESNSFRPVCFVYVLIYHLIPLCSPMSDLRIHPD